MSYSAKNKRRIFKNIEIHSFQQGKKKQPKPTKYTQTHMKAIMKAQHSPKKCKYLNGKKKKKKKCYSTLLWTGNWIENEIDDADVIFHLYDLLIQL